MEQSELIRNQYVYELEDRAPVPWSLFDVVALRRAHEIVFSGLSKPVTYIDGRRAPVFNVVLEKFPFLSPWVSLFQMVPEEKWKGLHVDISSNPQHPRLAALNVPLYEPGTCRSDTEFWLPNDGDSVGPRMDNNGKVFEFYRKSACTRQFVHQLRQPTILNILVPHTAINYAFCYRRIVSFSSQLSYDDTIQALAP